LLHGSEQKEISNIWLEVYTQYCCLWRACVPGVWPPQSSATCLSLRHEHADRFQGVLLAAKAEHPTTDRLQTCESLNSVTQNIDLSFFSGVFVWF
jgi:hypothetical protein